MRGIIITILTIAVCCYGDPPEMMSHLVLVDELPPTLRNNGTTEIEIRTNYSGRIEFRESDQFNVLLNITAPSIQEAYAVTSDIVDRKGRLLVQVYQTPIVATKVTLEWILILVAGAGVFMMVVTTIYAFWWNSTKKKYSDMYDPRRFLGNGQMYRSHNSMQFGAAGELLGEDDREADFDGELDDDRDKRKMDKHRSAVKPETIMEETEDDSEDERTQVKSRFKVSSKHLERTWSQRTKGRDLSNENTHGSGILDYPDQSGDEIDDDLSPDQKIADADGNYTPLDELDDCIHGHGSELHSAYSAAKLPDPRGNLDFNIHNSKSDGDLIDRSPKKFSERNKVIPPLTVKIPKNTGPGSTSIPAHRKAEPNIYQQGLNLKQPPKPKENDLSGSTGRERTRAHVHKSEYSSPSRGQYISLQAPPLSRTERLSRESNDAFEMYTYPAETPLSTFKAPPVNPVHEPPAKPVGNIKPTPIFTSGSPSTFDYVNLQPSFQYPTVSKLPLSPGDFSMLNEDSSEHSSSEIDDDDGDDYLRLDDSDLEIPPIDHEGDVLSNNSLPLPSPPPMMNQFVPYDVTGQISQLTPRHSFVSPSEDKEYGTMIAITGSPSPGGPFSRHSVNEGPDGSAFQFPPPPTMYNPPQHAAWARRELFMDDGGEYVGLPIETVASRARHDSDRSEGTRGGVGSRERRQSGGKRRKAEEGGDIEMTSRPRHDSERSEGARSRERDRERRLSGGRRGKFPKHLMHLTVLGILSVLSVMSGVYCATRSTETSVNIIVFVPTHIRYHNATIYTKENNTVDVNTTSGLNWFVSKTPILANVQSNLCQNTTCEYGCDDNSGACICIHGYVMEDGNCNDFNECNAGMSSCHPNAGCVNTKGSYECLCLPKYNLFWYKDRCLECSTPCPKGSYEAQPCDGDQKNKICRDCIKSCRENYYMEKTCGQENAKCKTCQPKCNTSNNEFEFSQCSATQNRECRDRSVLPAPTVSPNVIIDDLTVVRDETVEIPYLPSNFEGVRRFMFERGLTGAGSDFSINVEIKHFDPTSIFKSVDHAGDMDTSKVPAAPQRYCTYPVPSHYELKYTVHKAVSYKGNTTQGLASIEPCEGDPSNFPGVAPTMNSSIFCSEPGPLSNGFHMAATDYSSTATVWEDRSGRCRKQHEECESCVKYCAIKMKRSNNVCSVSEKDANGRSPRVPVCFSCCLNTDCAAKCRNYHSDDCEMVKCNRGNLVQFQLSPVYPSADIFYCHLEPVKQQLLIKVDYRVKFPQWANRVNLLHRNLSVHSNEEWRTYGKVGARDDIINVQIDSHLKTIPNFLQWAIGATTGRVGVYEATGTPIEETYVQDKSVSVRPKTPFGINPVSFGRQSCRDDVMHDVVMLTDNEGPIRVNPELVSNHYNGAYIISNRSTPPTVRVGINKDTSILKAIFPPGRLTEEAVVGHMIYDKTKWIVTLSGRLLQCPGFISINVTDPAYTERPLYQLDVGIDCPENFSLTINVPTDDSLLHSKILRIEVKDDNSTYTLTLHTPTAITERELNRDVVTYVMPDDAIDDVTPEEPAHFSQQFISIVAGIVLVLVFLLLFGIAWKQDSGIPGNILGFRMRNLVLLVLYMTVQFVYAVVVSMTVFVLVVIAVNGETTTFLRQYNYQRSVKTALGQLELDQLEQHLSAEILRQTTEAIGRKERCDVNIHDVLMDVHKLQQEIEEEAVNMTQRQNIKDLVTAHTRTALQQFKENVDIFRKNYESYETFIHRKLILEVESTYRSVQRNKWLTGAVHLHESVYNDVELLHENTPLMPFMEWVQMETDMTDLAQGLRLPLPAPPDLNDVTQGVPNTVPLPRQHTMTAPLPTQVKNHWIMQPSFTPKSQNARDLNSGKKTERVTTLDSSNYTVFIVVMIIIDIMWLLHRVVKAIGITELLLYGYPIYVDVRDRKADTDGRENEERVRNRPIVNMCRSIWSKALSTFFIPKLIGTIFICLMVYCISLSSYKFINRRTFSYLGYYTNMDDILALNEAAINSRIQSHAERINRLQYPMYEGMMNTHVTRHQHLLSVVESQWRAITESHSRAYCGYLRRINVTATCENTVRSDEMTKVKVDACLFPPVVPEYYERTVSSSSNIAQAQMDGFLTNIRKLISDTCHVILIYLAAVVMKELLGTVLWLYMKRSGFVSLRIIYETDEAPGSADTSTNK